MRRLTSEMKSDATFHYMAAGQVSKRALLLKHEIIVWMFFNLIRLLGIALSGKNR